MTTKKKKSEPADPVDLQITSRKDRKYMFDVKDGDMDLGTIRLRGVQPVFEPSGDFLYACDLEKIAKFMREKIEENETRKSQKTANTTQKKN